MSNKVWGTELASSGLLSSPQGTSAIEERQEAAAGRGARAHGEMCLAKLSRNREEIVRGQDCEVIVGKIVVKAEKWMKEWV